MMIDKRIVPQNSSHEQQPYIGTIDVIAELRFAGYVIRPKVINGQLVARVIVRTDNNEGGE